MVDAVRLIDDRVVFFGSREGLEGLIHQNVYLARVVAEKGLSARGLFLHGREMWSAVIAVSALDKKDYGKSECKCSVRVVKGCQLLEGGITLDRKSVEDMFLGTETLCQLGVSLSLGVRVLAVPDGVVLVMSEFTELGAPNAYRTADTPDASVTSNFVIGGSAEAAVRGVQDFANHTKPPQAEVMTIVAQLRRAPKPFPRHPDLEIAAAVRAICEKYDLRELPSWLSLATRGETPSQTAAVLQRAAAAPFLWVPEKANVFEFVWNFSVMWAFSMPPELDPLLRKMGALDPTKRPTIQDSIGIMYQALRGASSARPTVAAARTLALTMAPAKPPKAKTAAKTRPLRLMPAAPAPASNLDPAALEKAWADTQALLESLDATAPADAAVAVPAPTSSSSVMTGTAGAPTPEKGSRSESKSSATALVSPVPVPGPPSTPHHTQPPTQPRPQPQVQVQQRQAQTWASPSPRGGSEKEEVPRPSASLRETPKPQTVPTVRVPAQPVDDQELESDIPGLKRRIQRKMAQFKASEPEYPVLPPSCECTGEYEKNMLRTMLGALVGVAGEEPIQCEHESWFYKFPEDMEVRDYKCVNQWLQENVASDVVDQTKLKENCIAFSKDLATLEKVVKAAADKKEEMGAMDVVRASGQNMLITLEGLEMAHGQFYTKYPQVFNLANKAHTKAVDAVCAKVPPFMAAIIKSWTPFEFFLRYNQNIRCLWTINVDNSRFKIPKLRDFGNAGAQTAANLWMECFQRSATGRQLLLKFPVRASPGELFAAANTNGRAMVLGTIGSFFATREAITVWFQDDRPSVTLERLKTKGGEVNSVWETRLILWLVGLFGCGTQDSGKARACAMERILHEVRLENWGLTPEQVTRALKFNAHYALLWKADGTLFPDAINAVEAAFPLLPADLKLLDSGLEAMGLARRPPVRDEVEAVQTTVFPTRESLLAYLDTANIKPAIMGQVMHRDVESAEAFLVAKGIRLDGGPQPPEHVMVRAARDPIPQSVPEVMQFLNWVLGSPTVSESAKVSATALLSKQEATKLQSALPYAAWKAQAEVLALYPSWVQQQKQKQPAVAGPRGPSSTMRASVPLGALQALGRGGPATVQAIPDEVDLKNGLARRAFVQARYASYGDGDVDKTSEAVLAAAKGFLMAQVPWGGIVLKLDEKFGPKPAAAGSEEGGKGGPLAAALGAFSLRKTAAPAAQGPSGFLAEIAARKSAAVEEDAAGAKPAGRGEPPKPVSMFEELRRKKPVVQGIDEKEVLPAARPVARPTLFSELLTGKTLRHVEPPVVAPVAKYSTETSFAPPTIPPPMPPIGGSPPPTLGGASQRLAVMRRVAKKSTRRAPTATNSRRRLFATRRRPPANQNRRSPAPRRRRTDPPADK